MGYIEEIFDSAALAGLSRYFGDIEDSRRQLEPKSSLARICESEGPVSCKRELFFWVQFRFAINRWPAKRNAEEFREVLGDGLKEFEPVIPFLSWQSFRRKILVYQSDVESAKAQEYPAEQLQLYLNLMEHRESIRPKNVVEIDATFRRHGMAKTMEDVFQALLMCRQFDKARRIAENYEIQCQEPYSTHPRLGLLREGILGNRDEAEKYLRHLIEVRRDKAAPDHAEFPSGVLNGDSGQLKLGLKRTFKAYRKSWNPKTYATPRILRQYGSLDNFLEQIRCHLQDGWMLSTWAVAWMSLAWHRGMRDAFDDPKLFSEWIPWELCCPDTKPAEAISPKPKRPKKKISKRAQREMLFEAIDGRDHTAVQRFINAGVDLNGRNSNRRTALMECAHSGEVVIGRLLLRSGADPDLLDIYGRSAMAIAASKGDLKTVDMQLKEGVPADHAGLPERPLAHACGSGHLPVVKRLLKAGADPSKLNDYKTWTPLTRTIAGFSDSTNHISYYADELINAKGDFVGIVRELLKHGADPNVRVPTDNNTSALIDAICTTAPTRFVKLLLANGAEVNVRDGFGETPLHYAAENGNDAVVRLLLKAGAGKSVRNKDGKTPLDVAGKHPKVCKLLS